MLSKKVSPACVIKITPVTTKILKFQFKTSHIKIEFNPCVPI